MAEVPIAEQSPAELKRAARAGLAEVLVRVAGRTDAAQHPALSGALSGADRYVEQYRYDSRPVPLPVAAPGAVLPGSADAELGIVEPAPQPIVVLRFAASQIEGLLRQAGLPVWGTHRPTLLTWWAYDDGQSRSLVNEESHPELVQALRAQARRRGLLLTFPLLDLADIGAVTTDLVWQMDILKLQQASERYRSDGLLVGRSAALPGGRWMGTWNMVAGEERVSVDGDGTTLGDFLTPAIDRVADALARQYATVADGTAPGELTLLISDVTDFADYSRALAYLERLGPVASVVPVRVAQSELTLQVQIQGDVAQFQRALSLDSRLLPVAADPMAPVAVGLLRYRWAAR